MRSIAFPLLANEPFDDRWNVHQRGLWGERAVSRFLWRRGWRVDAHRWKATSDSDIDLVVAGDAMLIFAEVKLRAARDPDPYADALSPERMGRFRRAIGDYLIATEQPFVAFRVHAFLVVPSPHAPRDPAISMLRDYINPISVPGWRGAATLVGSDGLDDVPSFMAIQPARHPQPPDPGDRGGGESPRP